MQMDAVRFSRIAGTVANMTVRECMKSDIDSMVRLCNIGELHPRPKGDVLSDIGRESDGNVACRYYVVELGGETVGCFRLWWYASDNEAVISDIAVLPEMQGMGIGTEATRMAIELIRSRWSGCRICLAVAKSNDRARRMYDRLGFEPTQESDGYVWMVLGK